jgi:hypothetical protein
MRNLEIYKSDFQLEDIDDDDQIEIYFPIPAAEEPNHYDSDIETIIISQ